jgi:putative transport protein
MVVNWLIETFRAYPEIAIFLALGIGFTVGPLKVAGFSLGSVTSTLLAGVLIGQMGIDISPNVKATFFILFIFAVGYSVGPQFVRGLGKEGPKQIGFALVVLALCLIVPYVCAKVAGLPLGYGVGLYAGSQTISAAIGVASSQIGEMGLSVDQAKAYLDQIPIGYAVTYIFGTIGSASILAQLGPKLLGIDLPQACIDYEKEMGGRATGLEAGAESGYRAIEVRAYRLPDGTQLTGKPVSEILPGLRIFVERVRRDGKIFVADASTVLQPGDIAAFSGRRKALVDEVEKLIPEVEDPELLDTPILTLDVFVSSKILSGHTLAELQQKFANKPFARGIYLKRIVRNMIDVPVLPGTEILRGDIVTLVGSQHHLDAAVKEIGYADRPVEATDIAFVGTGITIGGLVGALTYRYGNIPISLSTSGGALLAGLVLGWLRTIHPTFGRIPGPALWLMNTLGLNVFIAVVGISAGPGFVTGLQQVGISLFLWGAVATAIPMIASIYIGRYLFKFHPAILFGACAGVRTTTAALGMIQEAAKSDIPALGYGMPYAVGNTLLTIFGMVMVLLLS